ncbi:MAG: hypothetical protein AVDCRST_MAG93-645 [uncultured Chloroflexia bacterium]|uniref:Uncharacterized protein n=1 Tax=uncultured Chloroflexia bacterium TaxID=1672391 RepID=A0A6J4HI91_9CHLR|nr:MAG: hypothetical protein AVDCRST_MAG93-645 [uncultured Chloroflexia bacterium]
MVPSRSTLMDSDEAVMKPDAGIHRSAWKAGSANFGFIEFS